MIKWGIIGCGDVTEIKSGPAFNKVPNSQLVAVMRRDAARAEDYAKRHNVPKWYADANELINDPEVNAIYIATPPLQHEDYSLEAFKAGKPVYVEKPMTVNAASAKKMVEGMSSADKLSVAHYRRAQPMFCKIKELIDDGAIGQIRYVNLRYLHPSYTSAELNDPGRKWRVDPAIAGGGLFHDLAPHQLDLMLFFFGPWEKATGFALNQAGIYPADDIVSGNIQFSNGVLVNGLWCFSAPAEEKTDVCEIMGSEGKISFSVFGDPVFTISKNGANSTIPFPKLEHVQQPMIEKVVAYFSGVAENPSSGENGLEVMKIIDLFTVK